MKIENSNSFVDTQFFVAYNLISLSKLLWKQMSTLSLKKKIKKIQVNILCTN